MKRISRLISLVILIGIFLSLCGCSYLDELRATRAMLMDNGTIYLNDGTEYILLPENEFLSLDFNNETYIYVVDDEEIPLLLTDIIGDMGYKTQDGQFLEVYAVDGYRYYCRADIYDSIMERLKGGFTPVLYCYSYFDYDYDNYGNQLYTFTPQQAEAIEYVLANREPYELPAGAKLDYEYRVELYQYSSDYLFRQKAMDICFADGAFYLVENGKLIYTVPNSLYVVLARAVKNANEYKYDY